MIIPHTNIRLLKSPIEIDYNNELTFSNITAQTNYFLSLPYVMMEECSYQRKEERIRFDKSFDELIGYNYCMYQNEDYSNKWFYAFINRIEYVDDSCSYVYITTDVYQTWMFNYTMKASYVEREHVSDDTIGKHTINEGLETGDYISNGISEYHDVSGTYPYPVGFACSDLPASLKSYFTDLSQTTNKLNSLNRIFTGLYIVGVSNSIEARYFIEGMNVDNKLDAIVNVFMLPQSILNHSTTTSVNYDTGITRPGGVNTIVISVYLFQNSEQAYGNKVFDVVTPSTLNGYTPKNNKLLVYPYSMFTLSNRTGSTQEYKFEDFGGYDLEQQYHAGEFYEEFALTGGGVTGRIFPEYYRNISINREYAMEKGKLPTCPWTGDAYTNWLSANAINLGMAGVSQGIMGAVALGRGLAGDLAGGIETGAGVIGSILNTQVKKAEAKRIPDTIRGQVGSGDINYSSWCSGYTLNRLTLKTEYLQQIDSFFTMFGYKVNELKVPNLWSRQNWNYIKTINVNLIGDIPQDDMQALKDMFNKGVTLWHNPSTFLDYSQDNSIIV